jgi:hypothetical protein
MECKNCCTLCLETYTVLPLHCPRILPCGHTFCDQCLNSCFQQAIKNRKYLECAICRVNHRTLTKVDQIPKNFALISAIEDSIVKNPIKRSLTEFMTTTCSSTNASAGGSTTSCNIIVCELCAENNVETHHAANYECIDCDIKMCNDIAKFHQTYKLTIDHQIVPLQSTATNKKMTTTTSLNRHENPLKRRKTVLKTVLSALTNSLCKEHGKTLDYFDEQCQKCICIDCLAKNHKRKLANVSIMLHKLYNATTIVHPSIFLPQAAQRAQTRFPQTYSASIEQIQFLEQAILSKQSQLSRLPLQAEEMEREIRYGV